MLINPKEMYGDGIQGGEKDCSYRENLGKKDIILIPEEGRSPSKPTESVSIWDLRLERTTKE